MTGHSGGEWEEWQVDLTPWAGKEVEVSISVLSSRVAYWGVLIDDVTLYRTGETELMFCVNAANVAGDFAWLREVLGGSDFDVALEDASPGTGLLALQGPASAETLVRAGAPQVQQLKRYRFQHLELAGAPALVSRTGYTGSDGFEIYVGAGHLVRVFESLDREGCLLEVDRDQDGNPLAHVAVPPGARTIVVLIVDFNDVPFRTRSAWPIPPPTRPAPCSTTRATPQVFSRKPRSGSAR